MVSKKVERLLFRNNPEIISKSTEKMGALTAIFFLIYLAFIFNIALISGITISNIGVVMMLITLFYISTKRIYTKIANIHLLVFVIISISFSGVFFNGIFVTMVNNLVQINIQTMLIAVSWTLMPVAFVFGMVFSKNIFSTNLRVAAAMIVLIVSISVSVIAINFGINHFGNLRYKINYYLPGGINGFLFGLMWLQILALGIAVESHQSLLVRFIGIIASAMPIFSNFFLGSRQFAIATFLLILSSIRTVNKGKERATAVFIILVVIINIVLFIKLDENIQSYVSQRIEKTKAQLSGQSHGRISLLEKTINILDYKILLGNGIGYTKRKLGRAVDNFWLEYIIDYGICGFILIVFCLALPLLFIKNSISKTGGINKNKQEYIIYTALLLTVFWYSLFNEIIREYIVWLCMGVMVSRAISLKKNTCNKN